jgi:hypothetical protein
VHHKVLGQGMMGCLTSATTLAVALADFLCVRGMTLMPQSAISNSVYCGAVQPLHHAGSVRPGLLKPVSFDWLLLHLCSESMLCSGNHMLSEQRCHTCRM